MSRAFGPRYQPFESWQTAWRTLTTRALHTSGPRSIGSWRILVKVIHRGRSHALCPAFSCGPGLDRARCVASDAGSRFTCESLIARRAAMQSLAQRALVALMAVPVVAGCSGGHKNAAPSPPTPSFSFEVVPAQWQLLSRPAPA